MIRSIPGHALLAAALLALVVPGVALAARPIAAFHDHFTETSSGDLCGIAVSVKTVVTDNFSLYADDSFKDTSSFMGTFTNPENGKAVVISSAGVVTGTAVVDEEAGTITFITNFVGLPERIQTLKGRTLARDAGIITFADTFDLATDEFLGSEVTITGPHPEAESDFALLCQVVTPALT